MLLDSVKVVPKPSHFFEALANNRKLGSVPNMVISLCRTTLFVSEDVFEGLERGQALKMTGLKKKRIK